MTRNEQLASVEVERKHLEEKLNQLIKHIGNIPIANTDQGLESRVKQLGFDSVHTADSEVGVFDFRFCYDGNKESYVNIKSAVLGGRTNKDDISKAVGLIDFYKENPSANLYVETFVISFNDDMTIVLNKCIVFPTAWIPDVYVNPSNNGNLQSSMYKNLSTAVKRTPQEFLLVLEEANQVALEKKKRKSGR